MKRTLLAASIATVITMPIVAYASDDSVDGNKIERVVVTGSNISRINKEGPTAVEIIKRADIEKSGATTVVDLLSKIPSVSVELDGNQNNSFAPGAAAVGLRGLPAKYTLILLNGRRLANYGFADGAEDSFVDLNNLPLSAIESIEILRDGASAIYGSDAVAGVINFKTRRNYQGVEVAANTGVNEKGDGATASASVTMGHGELEKDGYNFLLTADVFHSSPLLSDKHAATKDSDNRRFGGTDDRPTTNYLGSVVDYDNGEPGYAIPGCRGTVGISSRTHDQVCFNQQNTHLSPQNNRIGLSGIYTLKLNSTDELFAELGFNHNETTVQPPWVFPRFDSGFLGQTDGSTNPGLSNLPGPSADGSLSGFTLGDRLRVNRYIYESDPQNNTITSNTFRSVTGWRGEIGKWDSELGVSINQSTLNSETSNAVLKDVSNASLQNGLLGNGGYDPFLYANPSSVIDPMLTTTNRVAVSRLLSIDWKMSTPEFFVLNSLPVGFAWGLQANRETISDQPDPIEAAGNIAGSGATASKAGRSSYSVYGEFSAQLLKNLEAQFALRDDYYSDFGNSLNPKLAFSWRPVQEVLLRASATTSFKAPTLPEVASTTTAYSPGVADYKRCGPLGYVGAACSYSPKLYLQGNPDLKAEKANNYSLGIVFEPFKAFSASLDWYLINQKNTIQSLDTQYIIDHEDDPQYGKLIIRDPRNPGLEATHPGLNLGRLNSVITPYINVGKTDIQGLDLDLKYTLPLGDWGKLNFREVNDYTLQFKQSTIEGLPQQSRLDGLNHPRWTNTFRVGYEYGMSELAFTARTHAGTKNIDDPTHTQDEDITNARIPAYTVWDMNYNFKATKDLTINFGINNVFDKSPVFSNSTYEDTFVAALNDYVGRYYNLNMRYRF